VSTVLGEGQTGFLGKLAQFLQPFGSSLTQHLLRALGILWRRLALNLYGRELPELGRRIGPAYDPSATLASRSVTALCFA
jgi:hypothetical protein